GRTCCAGWRVPPWSELYSDVFALGSSCLEELPRREAEHPRDEVRREAGDLCVQVAHHRVVVAARFLQGVLEFAERVLQALELSGGLQLRILLRHGKQTLQCPAELVLRLRALGRARGLHRH